MPRTVFDAKNPNAKLLALLRGTAITKDKNFTDLGNMVGVTSKTITERFKNLDNMTLGELKKISRGLNIPLEDIRQCITY